MDAAKDKQQIGLTAVGQSAIERLMATGLFAAEVDAYRCAIAYAVGTGISPEDAPKGGYETKFNAAGTLDKAGMIRDLIVLLDLGEDGRTYATAEKLAELGVQDLDRRLANHESLGQILQETQQALRVGPEASTSPGS
mgnify:CR=1 FL=1